MATMTGRWPELLDVLTRDDLLRYGACRGGVERWAERLAPKATALPSAEVGAPGYCASRRDGYGDVRGDGFGFGYGLGDCDGDVNGDGYGFGDGDGGPENR